jgi:hypothetical protein
MEMDLMKSQQSIPVSMVGRGLTKGPDLCPVLSGSPGACRGYSGAGEISVQKHGSNDFDSEVQTEPETGVGEGDSRRIQPDCTQKMTRYLIWPIPTESLL